MSPGKMIFAVLDQDQNQHHIVEDQNQDQDRFFGVRPYLSYDQRSQTTHRDQNIDSETRAFKTKTTP